MSEKAKSEKAKLIHGLSNFHMAIVEKDDSNGVDYGEVRPIEGAVSVSVTPNTDSNTKYADNIAFAVLNNLEDIDVTMAAIDIPREIKKEMYGQQEANGVLFSNQNDDIKEVALGFEARIRGGGTRFYWFLKGMPEVIGVEHETDEGTIESDDAELNLTFTPLRANGNWKAELDSDKVTTEDWFEDVIYDKEKAEGLPNGEETGTSTASQPKKDNKVKK